MSHANGANGAATHDVPQLAAVASIAAGDNHQVGQTSPERLQKIRELLSEPFDPAEIKWRVTATSTNQTKHGQQKRGQLVAYADQRAYTDRLNEVFGEWRWTRSYDVQVAQNFERRAPGDKTKTAVAAKVVVVSRVTIQGLGLHTGIGEGLWPPAPPHRSHHVTVLYEMEMEAPLLAVLSFPRLESAISSTSST